MNEKLKTIHRYLPNGKSIRGTSDIHELRMKGADVSRAFQQPVTDRSGVTLDPICATLYRRVRPILCMHTTSRIYDVQPLPGESVQLETNVSRIRATSRPNL